MAIWLGFRVLGTNRNTFALSNPRKRKSKSLPSLICRVQENTGTTTLEACGGKRYSYIRADSGSGSGSGSGSVRVRASHSSALNSVSSQ